MKVLFLSYLIQELDAGAFLIRVSNPALNIASHVINLRITS